MLIFQIFVFACSKSGAGVPGEVRRLIKGAADDYKDSIVTQVPPVTHSDASSFIRFNLEVYEV